MEFMYIFPLIVAAVLLTSGTVGLLRLAKSRGWGKHWDYILPLIALGLGFMMFKVIYKPYLIYEKHFETITGMKIPQDREYLYAEPWYSSNISESRSSTSIVRLSEEEVQELENSLKNHHMTLASKDFKRDLVLEDKITTMFRTLPDLSVEREYYRRFDAQASDSASVLERREKIKKRKSMGFEDEGLGTDRQEIVRKYVAIMSDNRTVVLYIYND